MIARLKGLIEAVGEDWLVVDVNGVGYLVFCSSRTLARLSLGSAASLHIETHVREDHIHLYGFGDPSERDWFKLLTTVQGVGAKVGLAILSAASPHDLTQAIAAQDKATLTRANGVGPKLAVRILTELKDKVQGAIFAKSGSSLEGMETISSPIAALPNAATDAISALENLGYKRLDAFQTIGRIVQSLGQEADVSSLIRHALKELAPKA